MSNTRNLTEFASDSDNDKRMVFGLVLWMLLIALSCFWNIANLDNQTILLATSEARANWNKDQVFRKWASKHGGVYVKPDARTPPNPYLDRDVETRDGMRLTLMNPAYMMKQMTEEFEVLFGIKGRITGQVQLNPINKPDAWELQTLKAFDQGLKERIETADIEGKPYLRMMRPMIMEAECLKCHGHLGFKVGDIRGGVSVSVPLTPYLSSSQTSRKSMIMTHAIIWALGLLVIFWLLWRSKQRRREQTVVEETLRRAQKMEAIGQLTGGIAHDFNNILGIVLGNLNLLERELGNHSEAIHRVKAAEKAATRAADLTRQLLGFSRKQNHEKTPVSINKAILDMECLIARSVTPEVMISYQLEPDLWLTEVNLGDLSDSMLNLLINARDAMSGAGKLKIKTANTTINHRLIQANVTIEPGDYVTLTVSDTGCGIPGKILDRIFEPFFTTKPQGKGTGLGMSMVFGFVQRSRGTILVESEPGAGTSVTIYLPRSTNHADICVNTDPIDSCADLAGTERILIVDDEQGLLDVAQRNLEEQGYSVLAASSPEQALSILESEASIDLLLSDVVMPGEIDGYELSKRAVQLRPQLKTLLTSGFVNVEGKFSDENPFDEMVLNKPYSKEELVKRVRSVLDDGSESQDAPV